MKLNKKQKRTATIASMAALLAVVLGMGGQTFAKYISTQEVADQATIAKWGVVIRSSASTPFTHGDNNVAATRGVGNGTTTTYVDVVAPGTSGSFSLEVTGQPEVSAEVTIALEITDIYLEVLSADGGSVVDTYYPIVWTYGAQSFNGADAKEKLEKAVNSTNKYGVGDDLATSVSISWAWAFEVEDDTTTTEINESEVKDAYDTLLGDLANGPISGYRSQSTLSVSLTGTVAQVD